MIPRKPPVVLYDANLLYPFHVRNLFVQLGVDAFVEPRWTDAIHEEWIGNLVAAGKAERERLILTRNIMNQVLPNATVPRYEHQIAGLTLPDPNDRHVLAAAIEAKTEMILTFNIRDFPAKTLAAFGITAMDPDSFLAALLADDPEGVAGVVEATRLNLTRTAPTSAMFLDTLERQRLGTFVRALRAVQTDWG